MNYNRKRAHNLLCHLSFIYKNKEKIIEAIGTKAFAHLTTTPTMILILELGYEEKNNSETIFNQSALEIFETIERYSIEDKTQIEMLEKIETLMVRQPNIDSRRLMPHHLEGALTLIYMFNNAIPLLINKIPKEEIISAEKDLLLYIYEELFDYQPSGIVWEQIKEDFKEQIELLKEEEIDLEECAENLRSLLQTVK